MLQKGTDIPIPNNNDVFSKIAKNFNVDTAAHDEHANACLEGILHCYQNNHVNVTYRARSGKCRKSWHRNKGAFPANSAFSGRNELRHGNGRGDVNSLLIDKPLGFSESSNPCASSPKSINREDSSLPNAKGGPESKNVQLKRVLLSPNINIHGNGRGDVNSSSIVTPLDFSESSTPCASSPKSIRREDSSLPNAKGVPNPRMAI